MPPKSYGQEQENLISSYDYTYGGVTYTTKDTVKILRLKSNEFWSEKVSGSNTYEYHYITK